MKDQESKSSKARDLTGARFGRLIVLEMAPSIRGHAACKCICSCGTEKIIPSANLTRGDTKSCGCLRQETTAAQGRKLAAGKRRRFGRLRASTIAPVDFDE